MRRQIYLDIFWYKIDMFHNYCVISLLFVISQCENPEPNVIPFLFSYQTFTNFMESVAFTRITTCTEQKLYFRIIATFLRYLLRQVRINVL